MAHWLLSPPVAFLVILAAAGACSYFFKKISYRPRKEVGGSRKSYACGEEDYDNMAQPDYSTFFPFAFFFTLAHVATLMATTVTTQTVQGFAMAALYIMGAILGLSILLRR